MSNIYFTITGLNHYYGNEFLEKEMVVYLKKDKDNEYDREAISVNLAGLERLDMLRIAHIQYQVKAIVLEDYMIRSKRRHRVRSSSFQIRELYVNLQNKGIKELEQVQVRCFVRGKIYLDGSYKCFDTHNKLRRQRVKECKYILVVMLL